MSSNRSLRWLLDNRYHGKGGFARLEKLLHQQYGSSSARIIAISAHFEISPTQAHRWVRDYQQYVEPLT